MKQNTITKASEEYSEAKIEKSVIHDDWSMHRRKQLDIFCAYDLEEAFESGIAYNLFWTDVRERLPPVGVDVLIAYRPDTLIGIQYTVGKRLRETFDDWVGTNVFSGVSNSSVICWMYIPRIPQNE